MGDRQLVPDAWRDLNSTQRDILTVLAEQGPSSGREIRRALGDPQSSEKTTYRNLESLHELGYIKTNDRDGREREHELTVNALGVLSKAWFSRARAVGES